MKHLNILIQFFVCLLSSIYLTYIMSTEVLTTKLQILFIFLYFLIVSCGIGYFYCKKMSKRTNKRVKKRITILSIISTIALLYCLGNNIYPKQYSSANITISTVSGINNNLGHEVWITECNVDGKPINLSELKLDNGWIYKEDSDTIFADLSNANLTPLLLSFNKANSIDIHFIKHAWSGMVKISDGTKSELVDLYDKSGGSYIYEKTTDTKHIAIDIKCYAIISLVILLYSLCTIFYNITYQYLINKSNYL